ncbi:hypothetical protein Tco_0910616 [Tanacetum coccineum]|uniref:Uncharacterized protein n=1 Tax=Tanacetum coccineum TaxID=301880 RepID=A0ABQ5CTD8_9ASTR
MDDPNITIEEYIRFEEEKARRHGRTFNWQTAKFGKIKNYEDEDDCFIDFETEFPAMVFDNTLTAIPSEPTICPPNEHKIDFIISLNESDDEDYTIIFDENSFSGQALEKVAGVDLFYLRSMDRGTTSVPHLLAQYLFRHVEGKKSRAVKRALHWAFGYAFWAC